MQNIYIENVSLIKIIIFTILYLKKIKSSRLKNADIQVLYIYTYHSHGFLYEYFINLLFFS